jgi:lysophospholipase L1-like esterase
MSLINDGINWVRTGNGLLPPGVPVPVISGTTISAVDPTVKSITQLDNGGVVIANGTLAEILQSYQAITNLIPSNYVTLANAIRATLRGASNTRIPFIGDSTTAGVCETGKVAQVLTAWPAQVAAALTAQVVHAGHQSHYGVQADVYNTPYTAMNAVDPRTTDLPAAWTRFAPPGTFGWGALSNNTTVDPITYTPNVPTDTFDVYYIDLAAGNTNLFTIKAGATVVATAPASGNTGLIRKLTATATLGSNVWSIVNAATMGNGTYIVGWEAYNSAVKEVICSNVAFNGGFIDDWLSIGNTSSWGALNVLTSGVTKFDAVVLDFGINHWVNRPTLSATFQASLDSTVATLLAASVPVIFVTPNPSPVASATKAVQDLHVAAIYTVAIKYGIAVIDVYNKWGGTTALGLANSWHVNASDLHPTKAGYGAKAGYFANFIKAIL